MTAQGLLVGLIDIALTLCVLGMVAIGASFLLLVARFLYDEIRGAGDGSRAVPPLAEADLPHVVLQIPVFNEPRVVEGALRAAATIDWPRENCTSSCSTIRLTRRPSAPPRSSPNYAQPGMM